MHSVSMERFKMTLFYLNSAVWVQMEIEEWKNVNIKTQGWKK